MFEEYPTNIIKLKNGDYKATFDGIEITVSPFTENRHYRAIKREIDNGTEFTIETVVINPIEVKNEAQRRIFEICPEWKQRNLTAQATILLDKSRANWTQEDLDAWNAGEVIWQQISHIRQKSDLIEAMNPIPEDFRNDSYWI